MIPLRVFDPGLPTTPPRATPETVADVVRLYLAEKQAQADLGHYSPATVVNAVRYLNSFADLHGAKPLAECRNADLTEWMQAHDRWSSPHTKVSAVAFVIACFRWADEQDYVPKCPYRRRGLRLPEPRPRKPILESEYRCLLNAIRRSKGHARSRVALRCAVYFLWETGSRTCEMREADWIQVDWDRGVIELDQHKTDRTAGPRVIALSPGVLRLLALYQRRGHRKGRIFLNGRGRAWTRGTFGKLFRRYARLAGIRPGLTAYCLRHGFTCEGLAHGIGDRQLADLLGHASTRYVAWYGQSMRQRSDYLRDQLSQVHRK